MEKNQHNKKRNLLFVANSYPSHLRPWKCPFNHRAVKSLQNYYSLTVLTTRAWLPWRRAKRYEYDGIIVQEFLVPPINWMLCISNSSKNNGIRGYLMNKMLDLIVNQILNHCYKTDLIHSVSLGFQSFAAQIVSRKYQIPHFVELIGSDVNNLNPNKSSSFFFKSWSEQIAAFITNSNSLAIKFKELTNTNTRITTAYRGVDLNLFKPKSNKIPKSTCDFLYLGGFINKNYNRRGSDVKGADVLLRAWQDCEKLANGKISLILAGPYINEVGVNNFKKNLFYPENVSCIGVKPSMEIPELLHTVDVLIIPSRKEGLPNVSLEAMASGVPVIATEVGGLVEVISSNIDGILVQSESHEMLSNAIYKLYSETNYRESMSKKAREKVLDNFSSDFYVLKLRMTYQVHLEAK
jgi:glycosyltransferase involved in cell wall biosynthesis